ACVSGGERDTSVSFCQRSATGRRTFLRRLVAATITAGPLALGTRVALAQPLRTSSVASASSSSVSAPTTSVSLEERSMSQAANPAAPTIVLVHGAFADSSSWNAVLPSLLDQGYPVIAAANP